MPQVPTDKWPDLADGRGGITRVLADIALPAYTFRMAGNTGLPTRTGCSVFGVLLLGLVLALPIVARAAQVYKCGSSADGVVYTDTPCKGGERLDIEPGAADPAALERLERTRDALYRSADRRLADSAREAAYKAENDRLLRESLQQPPAQMTEDTYPYYDYAYAPGWYLPVRPKPPRPRPLSTATPRSAPKPPYVIRDSDRR